jgi:hypothetical protein
MKPTFTTFFYVISLKYYITPPPNSDKFPSQDPGNGFFQLNATMNHEQLNENENEIFLFFLCCDDVVVVALFAARIRLLSIRMSRKKRCMYILM